MASKNCKKKSHTKDATLARINTLRNKIRKAEKIAREHPANHCNLNHLTQLRHDLANVGKRNVA